jgi:hypothetical protein
MLFSKENIFLEIGILSSLPVVIDADNWGLHTIFG